MQSEMETAVTAPQPETEATKPDVKKRVPLTTIANAIPAKIKWEKRSCTSFIKINQPCNIKRIHFHSNLLQAFNSWEEDGEESEPYHHFFAESQNVIEVRLNIQMSFILDLVFWAKPQ